MFVVKNINLINLWSDPWIPEMPGFRAQPRNPDLITLSPNAKVGELIDVELNQWKRQELENLFTPECVTRIMNIPLDSPLPTDTLIWKLEDTQVFTVKSDYYTD